MMRKFRVSVNGKSYDVEVEEIKEGVSQPIAPAQVPVKTESTSAPASQATGTTGSVAIEAPMQGKVVEVKVSPGQTVNDGDVVAILEAMKMENEIVASTGGTVASVNVVAGQSVDATDVIITLN